MDNEAIEVTFEEDVAASAQYQQRHIAKSILAEQVAKPICIDYFRKVSGTGSYTEGVEGPEVLMFLNTVQGFLSKIRLMVHFSTLKALYQSSYCGICVQEALKSFRSVPAGGG